MQNFWHYCGVYLASDVLTLADVFMTFVEDVLDLYSLDPNAYFSTPSLAYQLMLKFAVPHKIHLIEDL